MKRTIFALLSVIVCCASNSSTQENAAPSDARQLLKSAHEISGLSTMIPYQLRAEFIVNPGVPEAKKGRITIVRDSERSRTELQIEDYTEIKLTLGQKLYIARSTPFPIPGLSRLGESDRTWDRLADDGDAKLGGVANKKILNVAAQCFDVKGAAPHRLCFDSARKVLLENLDAQHSMQFADYHTVNSMLLPSKITMLRELPQKELPILVIQTIEVQHGAMDAATWKIPEHATEFDTCENMQPAKPQQMPPPDFGANLARRNMGGHVNVYGIVDKEGNLQSVHVLSTDHQVQQTVLEALKKWRFQPAMCGTSPVATEREFPIPFSDLGGAEEGRGRRR